METQFSAREQIIEVVNKLFIYTDNRQWEMLLNEVFAESVLFDMSSARGGAAALLPATEICAQWEKGFEGIDAVHHQAGNYLVTLLDDAEATVHAYAIALHFKKAATHGNTRQFVGSYDLLLNQVAGEGWRINTFRYNLKFMEGNTDLS